MRSTTHSLWEYLVPAHWYVINDRVLQRCSQYFSAKILGYLFNWGLYGVLTVQVYLYYLAFPRDRVGTKCLVLGLYLAETIQTALATHDAFMTFGVNYGNIAALSEGQLSGVTVPVFSGIISCTVQLFYIYRIFILSSKSKPLVLVLCSIALAQGCAGIVTGIQTMQVGDLSRLQESDVFVSCTVWLVCAAVCDVIIAISMYYWLSKSETRFRATNVLISKLIRLAIETGSLTAMVATLEITLFLAFPGTDYHTAPALILAKLYSNSLVVTFNSRLRIVDGR
ncbi:hypothetical protein BD779DRAFT_1629511, partial [Infundibulicybe gibba]